MFESLSLMPSEWLLTFVTSTLTGLVCLGRIKSRLVNMSSPGFPTLVASNINGNFIFSSVDERLLE